MFCECWSAGVLECWSCKTKIPNFGQATKIRDNNFKQIAERVGFIDRHFAEDTERNVITIQEVDDAMRDFLVNEGHKQDDPMWMRLFLQDIRSVFVSMMALRHKAGIYDGIS